MVTGRKSHKILSAKEKFEIRLNREAGIPVLVCAQMADVSVATAMRALAELREKFGPEKIPQRKRHLVRSRFAMSQSATNSAD